MKQPQATAMQLWLASVHLTAAVLAVAWATTHLMAVAYHLDRTRQPSVLAQADAVLKEAQR